MDHPDLSPDPTATRRPNLPGHGFVLAAFSLCALAFVAVVASGDRDAIPLLSYPLVVALVPAVLRTRRWPRILATVLISPMATFIFSVGVFFAPAVVLMFIAACAPPRIDGDERYAAALSDDAGRG